MTADALQNGRQQQNPGANHPYPFQERANYDQDMPSSNIALQKHKGDAGYTGSAKPNIPVKENDKKRVSREGETQYRQNRPALLINSKTAAKADPEAAHGGQGDQLEHKDIPTVPGEEIRKLKLRDSFQMDEAGAFNGPKEAHEVEINPLMGVKSQGDAHHRQQKHLIYAQQANSGGWENFLPKRNLRVLLVEDDDSTRNVVGALLHNCGYEVTLAASGVQAWELLKDRTSNVDLALTDVMLPSLSGISLLAKIMNQESSKQIPVVMMSSLDSVDIVFKCLSKGAVDFLVKPVRKNELKNLWQHVWRKCHSSSGSGSGSGSRSQTGNVQGLKETNAIGHNSGSNDNEGSSLNAGGGSDNGSGTQGLWTKRGVKVESPRRPHECDAAHCSHGAQAHADIHTKSAMLPKYRRSSLDSLQAKDPDQVTKKGLEVTASRIGAFDFQASDNAPVKYSKQTTQNILPSQIIEQNAHLDGEGTSDQSGTALEPAVAIDLLGNIACQAKKKEKPHCSSDAEMDRGASNSPNAKGNMPGLTLLPTLELTLKRPHTAQEEDSKVEDRHVLRQSGASAFSRYSNSGAASQQQPHVPVGSYALASFPLQGGYVGCTAPPVTSTGAKQIVGLSTTILADRAGPCTGSAEALTPLHLHSQLACGASNQEMTSSVVGSSGQEAIVQAENGEGCSSSGMPMSIAVPSHAMLSFDAVGTFASARHPVLFTHSSNSPWAAANAPDRAGYGHEQYEDHSLPLQKNQQTYHHFSCHYRHHHVQHHYHHHAHRNSLSAEPPEDGQTVTNPGTSAPQCGSSNMIGTVPGNLSRSGSRNCYGMNGYGNGSVNGSVSGSNNASNTQNGNSNGQSGMMATAGSNGDCGNNNGNSGSGNGHGISSGNGSGVVVAPEQNCFTRREAALNKFRQKRKERCFEKKVRYQSRKRLAEQRPRVRGQFVRQETRVLPNADQRHANNELVSASADSDCDGADAEHDEVSARSLLMPES